MFFIGSFIPIVFKVIIDVCILIAISNNFTVLSVILFCSFLHLLLGSFNGSESCGTELMIRK